ncbi:MAG: exonuclease subunit SbcD, partial [Lachnospiraceae bacterium]|nr:exonuclease subunit SbcD [Lachnospiraceae bacterium]
MKLMHLSDLHIGKRVHGFSMLKDQQYILEQVLQMVDAERPDCVLLAGDIYDKPVPSAEAVTVLDEFLAGLYARQVCVCLVSGNHDSPERLDFGGRIFESRDIHVAGRYDGENHMVELQDEHGLVRIWLLPFVRPASLRPYEPEVVTYQEAVEAAVERMKEPCRNGDTPWESVRNVLVAHQFVVSGERLPQVCDSEELSLGTLDHVDVSAFDAFDYVALGHLHGPQQVGRPQVRYAGWPLKYSFSERHQKKSVTMAELGPKGQVEIRQLPLEPLRDLRQIQGTMEELLQAGLALGSTTLGEGHRS